jgi:hypothetical protein
MSSFLYTMYEYFNNYVIAKCLLSCDVFLMLIRSRQYTVLFPLKYWIELNDIFLSGTFYSQLMRYSRTCGSYLDFRDRRLLPTRMIMKPRFLQCFTVDTMTWWTVTEYLCSVCRNHNPVTSPFMTYHRVCSKSNTTGATSGEETVYPSGTWSPWYSWNIVESGVKHNKSINQ